MKKFLKWFFFVSGALCLLFSLAVNIIEGDRVRFVYLFGEFSEQFLPMTVVLGLFLWIAGGLVCLLPIIKKTWKRVLLCVGALLLAAAIFFVGLFSAVFTLDRRIWETTSPDGKHTVLVSNEMFFIAESVSVYERTNAFLLTQLDMEGDTYYEVIPEDAEVLWEDDRVGFRFYGSEIWYTLPEGEPSDTQNDEKYEINLRIQLDVGEDIGLFLIGSEFDGNQESGGCSNADRSMIKKDEMLYWSIDRRRCDNCPDSVLLKLDFSVVTEYCDPNYENTYPEEYVVPIEPLTFPASFGKSYRIRITGDKTIGYRAEMYPGNPDN